MTDKEDRLPVPLGSVIAGRYRVERIIGVGGMGTVMAGIHLLLDQPVAIKFLQPEALANPDVVSRFMREARAAVRIKSEHVARVLDVGALDSGAPYMVMERLDGSDLAALLRARGPLPIETAVDYMLQTLEAVAEAHSLGIVHRDLKPANLFLVSGRRADIVKVLDFGISKTTSVTGSAGMGVTETSAVFGTPAYMSPEQLNSARDVDARADLWSLGIILYELLAGRAPFRADTVPQLCVAIMNHPTPALRAVRNNVPPGLEAVIMRCLEKERTDRFSTAEDMALSLADYAPARSRASIDRLGKQQAVGPSEPDGAGATVTVNPQTLLRARAGDVPHTTQSEWGGTASGHRGRPRQWILAAGLGGIALALAGVVGMRLVAGKGPPAGEPGREAEKETVSTTSAAGSLVAQPSAVEIPTRSDPTQHPVAATATSSASPEASAMILRPPSDPRKSPLEKGSRSGRAPAGPTLRIAPTSSVHAPDRRPGSSEGWEDER